MKNKGEIILYSIAIITIVTALVVTATSCDGTVVRGLIWLQCIEGK